MSYGRELTPGSLTMAAKLSRSGLAEKPLIGKLYRALRTTIAGSGSEAQVWPPWYENPSVKVVGGGVGAFVVGSGNRDAGLFPRTYGKAMVLGLGKAAVEDVTAQKGNDCQPAVAYPYKGTLRVGALAALGELDTDGKAILAAGMRAGKRPLEATIGLFYKANNTLIIPDEPIVIADLVPVNKFVDRYPGVPLV